MDPGCSAKQHKKRQLIGKVEQSAPLSVSQLLLLTGAAATSTLSPSHFQDSNPLGLCCSVATGKDYNFLLTQMNTGVAHVSCCRRRPLFFLCCVASQASLSLIIVKSQRFDDCGVGQHHRPPHDVGVCSPEPSEATHTLLSRINLRIRPLLCRGNGTGP